MTKNESIVAQVHEAPLTEILGPYMPLTHKGKITNLETEDFEMVPLQEVLMGAEGYVEKHPEGVDRGGYVPMIFWQGKKVYWDVVGGVWQQC